MEQRQLTQTTIGAGVFWTMTFKMAIRIDALGRWMTAMGLVIALVYVIAIGTVGLIARLAFAVIPTGHIDTICR